MSNKLQRRVDEYCRRAREAEQEVSALKTDNHELRLIVGRYAALLDRYKAVLADRRQLQNG